MPEEQLEEINFEQILEDTQLAKEQAVKILDLLKKDIDDGDPDGAMTHTIKLRDLGMIPGSAICQRLTDLINTKGTPQQKIDFGIECAPLWNGDVISINDEIRSLSDKQKAQLCGTRTLHRTAGKQKVQQIFGIKQGLQARKAKSRLTKEEQKEKAEDSARVR